MSRKFDPRFTRAMMQLFAMPHGGMGSHVAVAFRLNIKPFSANARFANQVRHRVYPGSPWEHIMITSHLKTAVSGAIPGPVSGEHRPRTNRPLSARRAPSALPCRRPAVQRPAWWSSGVRARSPSASFEAPRLAGPVHSSESPL